MGTPKRAETGVLWVKSRVDTACACTLEAGEAEQDFGIGIHIYEGTTKPAGSQGGIRAALVFHEFEPSQRAGGAHETPPKPPSTAYDIPPTDSL